MKLKNKLEGLIPYAFSFLVVAAIFLLSAYVHKPALAGNTATNLNQTFVSCGPDPNNGNQLRMTVRFTWTKADNFQPGNIAPQSQYLDWATNPNPSSGQDVTGQSSLQLYGFIPNTDYWWRVNTDWGGFLGGWSPSTVAGPFSYSCPSQSPPPAPCSYSFTPQSTVGSGGTVNVTISVNPNTAAQSTDTFETGFSQGGTRFNQKTGPPGSFTLTAPTYGANNNYLVYATDTTLGASGQCALTSGTSAITITNASSGGSCTFTPVGGSIYTLSASVSGNTVTFTLTPPATNSPGPPGVIADSSTTFSSFPRPFDSGALAVGADKATWNNAPNGTYCGVVVIGTQAFSSPISFTVGGGGTGSTCTEGSTPFQTGVNLFNCKKIETGTFDDKAFVWNMGAGWLDSIASYLTGTSSLHPEVNSDLAGTGALAYSGRMVAGLYSQQPMSGVQYFAQKINDLNPVRPAYAQAGGIGYQALGPIQKIWVAFRNIAYVGFILVFVIIGFMIMFRAHISPQAVATVQDSVPRLVVALILVTFSYAIAGFMIDIMFLSLNILISALKAAKVLTDSGDVVFQKSVFGIVWGSWGNITKEVAKALNNAIQGAISIDLPFGLGSIAEHFVAGAGATIGAIVVGIAMLFIMFRIFFMLLMAYVMIIVLTIFAPFFFLIQALPGNNGAKEWFKQMASNVAVFPVVAFMFLLAGIIGGIEDLGGHSPGIIGTDQAGQFPLLTGGLGAIPQLIGIGFLLMTPSAAELVKNALGVKGQGGAAGAFAPGAAAIGASAGFLGRRASESSVGQAIGALSKQGGQNRAEWIMRHAPPPLKPRGAEPKFNLPTLTGYNPPKRR